MKAHLRTVKEEVNNYIDKETGELIESYTRRDKMLIDNEKDFVMMFSRVVGLYKGLNGAEIKMLAWLIFNQAPYNKNVVALTNEIKKQIAEDMDISLSSVNNSIPKLIKKGVFIRKGGKRSATYYINPLYFWKGKIPERNKALKYILEIEFKEVKANENFEKENQ